MKKKIMLLSIFVVSLFFVLINVDKKEVKAQNNCETHTYYYMFLDASYKYQYEERFGSGDSFTYDTTKYFKVPDKVNKEGYNVIVKDHGKVEVSYQNVSVEHKLKEEIGSVDYYNIMKTLNDLEISKYNYGYTDTNGIRYLWALTWNRETDSAVTTENIPLEMDASVFMYSVPAPSISPYTITARTTFGVDTLVKGSSPIVDKVSVDGEAYNAVAIDISRTYQKDEMPGSYAEADSNYVIWSPAVYYVDYEICSETEPEPEIEEVNLTVKHYEEGTTNQLWDDHTDSGVAGETYSYQCTTIPGYSVVEPFLFEGTYPDEDVEEICYYKKATYVLTVNYGDDPDCTKPIRTADSYDLQYGEKRNDISIPDKIGKLNNPKIGSFSDKFSVDPVLKGTNLSVEMPAKNVDVCIMYSPQTGISWIYFAWIIGGLSLGYSAWYFVRYYKKRNNEI